MGIIQNCKICESNNFNYVQSPQEQLPPTLDSSRLPRPLNLEVKTLEELLKLLRVDQDNTFKIGDISYKLNLPAVGSPNHPPPITIPQIQIESLTNLTPARKQSIKSKQSVESSKGEQQTISQRYSLMQGIQINIQHDNELNFNDYSRGEMTPLLRKSRLVRESFHTNKNREGLNQSIHFAYLFASPLVLDCNGELDEDTLDEISFKEEFNAIIEGLEPENLAIKYRYQLATVQNLIDALRQRAIGLHFSGHGLQNEKSTFKNISFYNQIKDKGDMLVFEEQSSGISWLLFENQLKQILLQYPSDLQFVVVASCHSERCGEIFRNAGAQHVICVDKTQQLNDQAAVLFSRTFYTHVFASTLSICKAFQLAKDHVEINFGPKESSIFKLLLQPGHSCGNEQTLMERLFQGKIVGVIQQPQLLTLPSNINPWISRNLDCYGIIQMLLQAHGKIVEVFGMPGTGKSSIIKKVANYVADRNMYPGGVLYINFSGVQSINDALGLMIQKVDSIFKNPFKRMQSLRKMKVEEMLYKIFDVTRSNQKILFVFDNVDDLIQFQQKQFIQCLKQLIQEKNTLQILFSSSLYVDGLDRFMVKKIKGLPEKKARDLFICRLPSEEEKAKVFNRKEILRLHEITMQKDSSVAFTLKFCNFPCKIPAHKQNQENCILTYLQKHPLFKILNYPLSVCLASSLLYKYTISQIYEMMISNELFKDQGDSLFLSIEYTVQMLQKDSFIAVDMFYLIGQTFNGLSLEDLKTLFQNREDIPAVIKSIEDTSLITYDPDTQNYKVQNFILKYVQQKVDDKAKTKLNRVLASHYIDLIIMGKKDVTDGKIELDELFKLVERYEKNILHCMNQLEAENSEFDAKSSRRGSLMTNTLLNSEYSNYSKRRVSAFSEIEHQKTSIDLDNVKSKLAHLETNMAIKKLQTLKPNFNKGRRQNYRESICEVISEKSFSDESKEDHKSEIYAQNKNKEKTPLNAQSDDSFVSSSLSSQQSFSTSELDSDEEIKNEDSDKLVMNKKFSQYTAPLPMAQSEICVESLDVLSTSNTKLKHQVSDSDSVEVWEKKGYKEAIRKMSIFGQKELFQPSNAINSYLELPERQQNRRQSTRRIRASFIQIQESKNQQDINVTVNNNQSSNYLSPFQKLKTQRNIKNDSPIQQFSLTIECIDNKESNLQEELKATTPIINETSELSSQTSRSNQDEQNPIDSDIDSQYDPAKQLEQDIQIQSPSHRNSQFDLEFDEDAEGESQILLYHFMSVVAVKTDSIAEFLDIRDRYLTEKNDQLLKANIQLLLVYLFIKFENYESAATELSMLDEIFHREESILGQAIVQYFLAYVFKALKRRDAQQQAMKYIQKAQELFQKVQDEEGERLSLELKESMLRKNYKFHDTDLVKAPIRHSSTIMTGDNVKGIKSLSVENSPRMQSASIKNRNLMGKSAFNFEQLDSQLKEMKKTKSNRVKLNNEIESLNLLINQIDL